MRAFVFTDKALGRYAGRFVWLAIDTENEKNAPFLRKFPISVWPTLLVIDPKTETIALRYLGGGTVPQLAKLLDDGARVVGGKAQSSADSALARADRLAGSNKPADALKAYEEALRLAPKSWPKYGRAVESTLMLLSHEPQRCVALATAAWPRLASTSSAVTVAASGMDCASELPKEDPARRATIERFESDARTILASQMNISGDDRSSLYESIIGARESLDDAAGAKKVAGEWAAFLEHEAARAKTPEQRAVYDPHRMGAYMKLEQPERALPMLLQSERELPGDYNPPARLATIYKAMGKLDEALAASDRALTKAYGPRKLGILRTRADIFTAMHDDARARKTIDEAIALAESFPEGQRNEKSIEALKKKRAAM
jgi:tetratricopeptide (TPR) repeat protein